MISTTITINSITQLRRHTQILKVKRVPHLQINTNLHPYTISFTTRFTKQTNNNLKKLHLQALQPYALAAYRAETGFAFHLLKT